MRLLGFVSCGRPTVLPEDPPPSRQRMEEALLPSPRLREETAAPPLSPTTCAYAEKSRRRSASPWRPSLVAISEDGTPVATAGVAANGAGRGGGSRMSKAKSTGRVLARTERDGFRHYEVPTVLPSFSPTAFLF
ncbi:translation initiation factor IF-2 [Cocos nucifera]|uniref:Translation initiation factor IF-2 n=1 Tax=Cocos nucifera TaxID=13894 RepID=A0A8K0IV30_COCNU|nr:translation initiation factor IF-2 [Cocos nucifera]